LIACLKTSKFYPIYQTKVFFHGRAIGSFFVVMIVTVFPIRISFLKDASKEEKA